MTHAKAHRLHDKNARAAPAPQQTSPQEAMDILIRGIDKLIAQAQSSGLGMGARILYTAKEEMVHWAVTMNFHESPQDRFINRHLYDNRLSAVEALVIRAIRDSGMGAEMLDSLGVAASKLHALDGRK